jgi:lysozyme
MSLDIGESALVIARLKIEESFVHYLYDDATDLPVKAPVGNATIGYGFNAQAGISEPLAALLLSGEVSAIQAEISDYPWYFQCNAPRRSVLLDIAYNAGVEGLMEYKHLFKAILNQDWQTAANETDTSDADLKSRYLVLAQIMLTGVIAS